jgi:hypothetical protein
VPSRLARHVADGDQPLPGLHADARNRVHQRLEVGVTGTLVEIPDRTALHHLAVIDDDHVLRHVRDHTQIVGDQQDGHSELTLQAL